MKLVITKKYVFEKGKFLKLDSEYYLMSIKLYYTEEEESFIQKHKLNGQILLSFQSEGQVEGQSTEITAYRATEGYDLRIPSIILLMYYQNLLVGNFNKFYDDYLVCNMFEEDVIVERDILNE